MNTSDDSLPLELIEQLDRLADEFEIGLRSKQPLSIEELLNRESALPAVAVLRELLRIELELRNAEGLACDEAVYLGRFPDHQGVVQEVFAAGRSISGTRPDIERAFEGAPARLGRYDLIERLGSGGFGIVYLARDTELDRLVAVKFPRPDMVASEKRVETLVREARAAAKLQHPVLVTVHDVQVENNLPFVVYQYVRGEHLGTWSKRQQLDELQIAKLLIAIADALEYAHELEVVHCDLKLSNILVDMHGNPHVTDFGLSRSGEASEGLQHVVSGTPEMMSPEQIDGEASVDRRTDIWAMGVMLYELLAGARPFQDEDRSALFAKIKTRSPTDLQSLRTSIPAALSDICKCCLAKDVESRFQSAAELGNALRRWADGEQRLRGALAVGAADVAVTPRGLLEFDERDAAFYLRLLSGARDAAGVPTAVRFWLEQMECTDAAAALRVGLVYGASGSGKSSLVRAGLIPHVDPDKARVVYCRAVGDGFDAELLGRLRGEDTSLAHDRTLAETLQELAGRVQGPKTVIVVDQFEQWLHSHGDQASQQVLVDALTHCNGDRLQVILIVRDDFFASVNIFFQQLGIALREGENYTLVLPFSNNHARYVLEQFGYGYGCLTGELSDANRRFLEIAIELLSKQGSASGLHVAWFAAMMQSSPWVPATLNRFGGLAGIGVAFLDERISSSRAAPHVRACEPQIRSALKLLIPPAGVSIRGRAQSAESLRAAADCADEAEWTRLLGMLERELRLISPVETSDQQYQLTHDYLVPSLRLWLSRKEGETVHGRTQQKLEVMEEAWRANPQVRYLPSFLEWLQIAWLAPRRTWTQGQRRLMQVASRYYFKRIAAVMASAAVLATVLFFFARRQYANGLVQRVFETDVSVLSEVSRELQESEGYVLPVLDQRLKQLSDDAAERLKGDLATLWREGDSEQRIARVVSRIGEISVDDLPSVAGLLRTRQVEATQHLKRLATESGETKRNLLLRSMSLLAGVAPSSGSEFRDLAMQLVLALVEQPRYSTALEPYREMLYPGLRQVFLNQEQEFDSYQVGKATTILISYYEDDAERLRDLALDATPAQLERILESLKRLMPDADKLFAKFASQEVEPNWNDGWTNLEVASGDPAAELLRAEGMLTENFALCQALPMQALDALHVQLAKADYQLVRLRPYRGERHVLCAAVWRKGHPATEYRTGLTSAAVMELAQTLTSGKVSIKVPIDVAGYVGTQVGSDGTEDSLLREQYCLIWSDNVGHWEKPQVYVGVDESQQLARESLLAMQNIHFCPAIQCFRSTTGERKYCGIVCSADSSSISVRNLSLSAFGGLKDYDRLQWDIDLEQHTAMEGEHVYAKLLLEDWNSHKDNSKNWIQLEPMFSRAADAMLRLGDRKSAAALCQKRLSRQPHDAAMLAVKIEIAASAGDRQAVDKLLERFARLNLAPGRDLFVRASALAYFDAESDPLRELRAWQDQRHTADSSLLAARAFARCSQVLAERFADAQEKDGEAEQSGDESVESDRDGPRDSVEQRVQRYEQTALDLLAEAIELGFDDWVHIERRAEFSNLRSKARYGELKQNSPAQYVVCGSRTTNVDFTDKTLVALPPGEHLTRARELAAQGYRPVAISVAAHTVDDGLEMRAASVWHRPTIPMEVRRQAAVRQSNAAVAMWMLGQPGRVWPLLAQQPDPQVRTRIIHLLAGTGCPSDPLVERLGIEQDISRRRAMILALGEYDWEQVQDVDLKQLLIDWFRDDPDPGIHAACWWTLEQWGARQQVDAIHSELASDTPLGERRWFRDKLDQHTFAIFPGPVEFMAGNRQILPEDLFSQSGHRRRIRRSFAIAMREVTVEQYKKLLEKTEVVRLLPRAVSWHPECSVGGVDWQMATIYCCMLNKFAGFPGRQWPTEVGDDSLPVRFRTSYLSRTGYRLPTAAEWEYAAKGGVDGNWFYGDSQEFSAKYAWSSASAENRSHPVGRLKPNDFGLFDMLGNSAELMLEPRMATYSLGEVGDDIEIDESFVGLDALQPGEEKWPLREPIWQNKGIGRGTIVTVRGGSFWSLSAMCNANEIETTRAHDRKTNRGFRVARTIAW